MVTLFCIRRHYELPFKSLVTAVCSLMVELGLISADTDDHLWEPTEETIR